jgi:hypothetical protein
MARDTNDDDPVESDHGPSRAYLIAERLLIPDLSDATPYRMRAPEPLLGMVMAIVLLVALALRVLAPTTATKLSTLGASGALLGVVVLLIGSVRHRRFVAILGAVLGAISLLPTHKHSSASALIPPGLAYGYFIWVIFRLQKGSREARLAAGQLRQRRPRGAASEPGQRAGRRSRRSKDEPTATAAGRPAPPPNARYTPPKSKSSAKRR